jgi:hypothetical protein
MEGLITATKATVIASRSATRVKKTLTTRLTPIIFRASGALPRSQNFHMRKTTERTLIIVPTRPRQDRFIGPPFLEFSGAQISAQRQDRPSRAELSMPSGTADKPSSTGRASPFEHVIDYADPLGGVLIHVGRGLAANTPNPTSPVPNPSKSNSAARQSLGFWLAARNASGWHRPAMPGRPEARMVASDRRGCRWVTLARAALLTPSKAGARRYASPSSGAEDHRQMPCR